MAVPPPLPPPSHFSSPGLCSLPSRFWEATADHRKGRASFRLVWISLDGADRVFVEFICSLTTEKTRNVYKRILYASSGNRLFTARQRSSNVTVEPGLQRWSHCPTYRPLHAPAIRGWRAAAAAIRRDLTSTTTTHAIIRKCIRKDLKQYCILTSGHVIHSACCSTRCACASCWLMPVHLKSNCGSL